MWFSRARTFWGVPKGRVKLAKGRVWRWAAAKRVKKRRHVRARAKAEAKGEVGLRKEGGVERGFGPMMKAKILETARSSREVREDDREDDRAGDGERGRLRPDGKDIGTQ